MPRTETNQIIDVTKVFCCLMVMGLLSLVAARQPGQAAGLKPSILRIGITKSCFQGVNKNDAKASFKAFVSAVGRQRGYELETIVEIYDDLSIFQGAIEKGKVQLAVIDAWQYLSMNTRNQMTPYFIPAPKDKVGRSYVILTRRSGKSHTLGDLKGKDFVRLEMGTSTMGQPWLETLLLSNGFEREEHFFGEIEIARKPSSAVLPVFFGKKQACLVDMPGFDIMKELNPQLGRKLQVIAASEPYIGNVICLANDGWTSEQHKQDVIQGLGELHLEPAGHQILTLFKSSKLVPFKDTHMETIRQLRAAHDKMRKVYTR